MISKFIRLIISGVFFLGAIALFVYGMISWGVLLVFLSGFMVLFHFKNEMNLLAFLFVRQQKMSIAGTILSKVKHPERMVTPQEAYHHFLLGLVASSKHDQGFAERSFKKALSVGLRMDNDRAMSNLALSGIYLSKRNKKVAALHLKEAKKLDKMKMLTDQIREIETVMKRM